MGTIGVTATAEIAERLSRLKLIVNAYMPILKDVDLALEAAGGHSLPLALGGDQ